MTTGLGRQSGTTVIAEPPTELVEKLQLKVGGMHCSLCTDSIRRSVGRLDGVRSVQVSIAHEEALIEYDPRRVDPLTVREALEDIGYTVREPDEAERFAEEERELATAWRSAILATGLLIVATALMLVTVIDGPSRPRSLVMGALAVFTAFGPARFIIVRNGWQSIRRGILFEARPGRGVIATVAEQRLLVGTRRFLRGEDIETGLVDPLVDQVQECGQTAVLVAVDGRAVGVLALADRLKPDAPETVAELRLLGLTPVLLTGDNWRTARAVAAAVGIDEVRAEVLPADKAAEVRRLQGQGQKVAMVGDGINDAPALMQADVGIAMGAGTDIAIESADVVLTGNRLRPLVEARELASRSYRLTVSNVMLALAFNGVGVLAAMSGLVEPIWAMVAMALSVSVVLGNSFAGRLLPRRQPPRLD